MKKIILTALLIIFILPIYVFAEIIPHTIYALSTYEIQSCELKENNYLSFHVLDNYTISDLYSIEEGATITVKTEEYISPKRGKRDGYLKIKLISYTIPSESNRTKNAENLDIYGTLRLSNQKDKKEIAKTASIAVVGHILKVPGLSQTIAVSKGLIKPNPEQNRIQSAGTNLYESTPLSLTKKGEDLIIEEDAIVVIRLKTKESSEE